MRTIGVYLIFAAVVLRGVVISMDRPYFMVILELLAAYGAFLFLETWIIHRKPLFQSRYTQLSYLLLQSAIVISLLSLSDYGDVFVLLFIPLSLDAVSFFGRRLGYLCIAVFSLAFTATLLFSEESLPFGLTMGIFFSGMCFLFGGYVNQVQKAEAAHDQNQIAFSELQSAHHQLQGYADQVANLAVERERSRMARDLHDSVTQTVFSMNLAAQSAFLLLAKESRLDAASVRAAPQTSCSAQLLRVEELAAIALSEIQSLISQLKPRSIVEEGLPSALRALAEQLRSRDGLQVSLETRGEKKVSDAETLGLYSIAHEALVNVARHSGTDEAVIRLFLDDNVSYLEIEDQGCGFDLQAAADRAARGHLGLAGMSERALEIGWSLSVESRPQQGTRIRVTQNQAGTSR